MSRLVEVDWRNIDGVGVFTRSYPASNVAFEPWGIKLRETGDALFTLFRPWNRVSEVRVVDLPDQDQEETPASDAASPRPASTRG